MNAWPSYYDSSLQDHVITNLRFILTTTDLTTGKFVKTHYDLTLPAASAETFIPCSQVTEVTAKAWIDGLVDIVALQNENVEKLQNT